MLTASQFDELAKPITDLYEEMIQTVIADIARRLAGMDYATQTAAWQVQRINESGAVYKNILKELAKLTGKKEAVLRKMFREAGVKSMKFDDSIYKAAGLNPLPLNMSPAMLDVLKAGLNKTNAVVNNLTMTMASAWQQQFVHAADIAYMQVTSGAMGYDQAIKSAIKTYTNTGLVPEIEYPSGHKDKLDVAMRRAVLTGVAQTTGVLQTTRADEMGVNLVQTSAHIGARPTHQPWQGHIFSRSGKSDKYPDFVEATGYGTMLGLCGINCRHSFYPFFEGISENAYKQATLDEYADKKVVYNGKEYSVYEAEQRQRVMERSIRAWKRKAIVKSAAKLDNTFEMNKVRGIQSNLRDFIKQTKLDRQYGREGGLVKRVVVVPPPPVVIPQPVVKRVVIPRVKLTSSSPIRISTDEIKIQKSESDIEHGMFESERVSIMGNGDGILKTDKQAGGWGDFDIQSGFAKREVMAYELDQALELNIVPKTVPFIEGKKYHSLQSFVPNAKIGREASGNIYSKLTDKSEPGKMMLLDTITANKDRHGGNWLISNNNGERHLHAIDNGLTMVRTRDDVRGILDNTKFKMNNVAKSGNRYYLPIMYKDNLQRVFDSGKLKEIFETVAIGHLDIDTKLIEAALKRVQNILELWTSLFYGD